MSPARSPLLRQAPLVQLEHLSAAVREALGHHYLVDAQAATLHLLQYEDNAVWRVELPDGRTWVARLSVREARPAEQQRCELRWLAAMDARGIRVPFPIDPAHGGGVVELDLDGLDAPAILAVFRWLPGVVPPRFGDKVIAGQMGDVTARVHLAGNDVDRSGFDRPVWDADSLLLRGHALTAPAARRLLGSEGTRTLSRIADRVAQRLVGGPGRDGGLIHADLHRENLIEGPDGQVGVIDFDDCGTGPVLLDIATVLSSVHRVFAASPERYRSFAQHFLSGYAGRRPLPARFDEELEDHLLLRDAFVLNFVTAAVPVNQTVATWGPARIEEILGHMRRTLSGVRYPGSTLR